MILVYKTISLSIVHKLISIAAIISIFMLQSLSYKLRSHSCVYLVFALLRLRGGSNSVIISGAFLSFLLISTSIIFYDDDCAWLMSFFLIGVVADVALLEVLLVVGKDYAWLYGFDFKSFFFSSFTICAKQGCFKACSAVGRS